MSDHPQAAVIAALRCASMNFVRAKAEIDEVGIALKAGLVTVGEAFDWLDELGARPLVDQILGAK